MAAGNTYTPLATQTLSSAAATVTFSSISNAYTDLVLVYSAICSSGGFDVYLRFNGDTSANYSLTTVWGNGSTTGSFGYSNQTGAMIDYYGALGDNGIFNVETINIMNYANTTTNKSFLARASKGSSGVDLVAGLWRNTAAINSITFYEPGARLFGIGSTFTLYGIAAA